MKRLLALSLSIMFTGSVFAQTPDTTGRKVYTMNLQQCIDYAMHNSSSVQNTALDEQIAHRKVQEFLGYGLPQISGSVNVQDYLQIPTSLIPGQFFGEAAGTFIPIQFGTQYNTTVGVQGSQLIADGTFFLGVQAAKTYEELSTKNSESSKIDLVSNVSKAYYGAMVARENMKVINANLAQLKKLFDDTKALFDQGFVEKVDMDRASVSYTNVLAEKEKAQNNIALSFYLLKYQIGMDVNSVMLLADSLENTQLHEDIPVEDSVDYNSLITYQLLQTKKSLDLDELKKDRIAAVPSLYFIASYSTNAQRTVFNFTASDQPWFQTSVIGVQLRVPILSGLSRIRRDQEDKLQLQEDDNTIRDTKNGLNFQLRSAKTTLINNYKTMDEQKQNSDLAENVFKATKAKFDQGIGSNLEVTEAQTALEEAQTNYLNAVYNALIAKIDLEKAMGTLYK